MEAYIRKFMLSGSNYLVEYFDTKGTLNTIETHSGVFETALEEFCERVRIPKDVEVECHWSVDSVETLLNEEEYPKHNRWWYMPFQIVKRVTKEDLKLALYRAANGYKVQQEEVVLMTKVKCIPYIEKLDIAIR